MHVSKGLNHIHGVVKHTHGYVAKEGLPTCTQCRGRR